MEVDYERKRRSKKFPFGFGLQNELERLQTFINWPVSWMKPEDLAKDGFYYLRKEDHTACAFCKIIIGRWEREDIIRSEHQRISPHCPFIRNCAVGNIPSEQGLVLQQIQQRRQKQQQQTSSPNSSSFQAAATEKVGQGRRRQKDVLLTFQTPKNLKYVSEQKRVNSFRDSDWPWPQDQVTQTPEELSIAGFFYLGLSDHVRCYHCGGGLRNWEIDDDPWELHAKFYPQCLFIKIHHKAAADFAAATVVNNPPPPPPFLDATFLDETLLGEAELELLMQLDIPKEIVQMGFPYKCVKSAIRKKVESDGDTFDRTEECIEATLQYMENTQKNATQTDATTAVTSNITTPTPTTAVASNITTPTPTTAVASNIAGLTPITTTNVSSFDTTGIRTEIREGEFFTTPTPTTAVVSNITTLTPTTNISSSATTGMRTEIEEEDEFSPSPTTAAAPILPSAPSFTTQTEIRFVRPPTPPAPTNSLEISMNEQEMNEQEIENEEIENDAGMVPLTNISITKCPNCPKENILNLIEKLEKNGQEIQSRFEKLEKEVEKKICKICMDMDMDMIFLPCRHMVMCGVCSTSMTGSQCPICRQEIHYMLKVILA